MDNFIPKARKKLEEDWAKAQGIDNELRAIYQAKSYDQAIVLFEEAYIKWGQNYHSVLDHCKTHWTERKELRGKKKNSPAYQKWLDEKQFKVRFTTSDLIACAANFNLGEEEIGFCEDEGIVCSWPGVDHMRATFYYNGAYKNPRVTALFLGDD